MMKKVLFAALALAILAPSSAMAWPWSQDMMNQPSIKPQEGVPKPFPKRSVPTTGIPTPSTIPDRDATEDMINPVPATAESIAEGKVLFNIYCSACHGATGQSESPVAEKMGAPMLADSYVQNDLTEGWIWGTMTFGGALMPSYGKVNESNEFRGSNDLSPTERWHVVNYIKNGLMADAAANPVAAE